MADTRGRTVIDVPDNGHKDLTSDGRAWMCPHGNIVDPGLSRCDHCDRAAEQPNEHAGATWRPVDLEPYLSGTFVRAEPRIGITRTDGLQLLYPGKEHAVIGEMESGKSWLAIACVVAELTRGNQVLYVHFEEADPADTIERLQALDVPDRDIAKLFVFVGPNGPADQFALAALLTETRPSLVILDGVNEAMSMHRLNPREEDAVAVFRHKLVKPCTAIGAAVLSCDHVVKDKDKRDRTAMGSIHKGNGLTGSLILLENVAPYGRGERGCSHLYVTKDRPGYLRRNGRSGKIPGKTYMGSLIVDDTRTRVPYTELVFVKPADETPQAGTAETRDQADDNAVVSVVAEIAATGIQPALRTVRAKAGMNAVRVSDALTRLVLDGRLTEQSGPRNSRLFNLPATGSGPVPTGSVSDRFPRGGEPVTHTQNQSEPVGTSGEE